METINALVTRRSIRTFDNKRIDASTIRTLVGIAQHAPSWKNSQTTRYICVMDKAIKDRIASDGVMNSAHNKSIIDSAPCLMVIATKSLRSGYERDGSFSTSKGTHFESFDAGIATDELCIAAHDSGIASVILGILDEDAIKGILNMDDSLKVSALVALGYSDSTPDMPKRRPLDEVLTIL